ncbi:MAG: insulinase family protein [Ruminococcaceae bacterium]|nr:insulinase family protein [Oscillospiraceae bacterium]
MKDFEMYHIGDGVDIVYAETDKFKTSEIAITFLSPLEEKTAAANALLCSMLSSTTKAYPTVNAFNRKLAMLYGARAIFSVSKLGENQALTLMVSSLADRFAIDGESISTEAFRLLCDMLFAPNLDVDGNFFDRDIKREKKQLTDKLDAEFNEKRIYSLRRLESIMFEGEPYAVNKYGTKKAINALTGADLLNALKTLKQHSKIQITVVGKVDIDAIRALATERFNSVERAYKAPEKAVFKPCADTVKDVSERMEVEQGKLVIGFRVNREDDASGNPVLRLFTDVFGGGPYSKLFNNVREKLSLCYYCSARPDRRKSNVIIQCGCEEENMDKALTEIQNQLDSVKNGDIVTEIEASKMALSDMILSVCDDSLALCSWYINQISDNEILTPQESAAQNNRIEIDDITACAKLLTLDTVFRLVPEKEVG